MCISLLGLCHHTLSPILFIHLKKKLYEIQITVCITWEHAILSQDERILQCTCIIIEEAYYADKYSNPLEKIICYISLGAKKLCLVRMINNGIDIVMVTDMGIKLRVFNILDCFFLHTERK